MYTSTPNRKVPSSQRSFRKIAYAPNEAEEGSKNHGEKNKKNTDKSPKSKRMKTDHEKSTRTLRTRSIGTPSVTQGRLSLANRTGVRATPYRTPKLTSKIHEVNLQSCNKTKKEELLTNVKELLNYTWKVSYVSSLFNFHIEKLNLKRSYESFLKIKILEKFPANFLNVEFKTTQLPTNDSSTMQEVLVLNVSCLKLNQKTDEEERVIVYTGYFFLSEEQQINVAMEAKWYPLLLYRGPEPIQSAVSSWMSESFSCYVVSKGFPQSTLFWISGAWTRYKCSKSKHNSSSSLIELQYRVKPILAATKKDLEGEPLMATVSLQRSDIDAVWKCVEKVEKIDDAEVLKIEPLMRFSASLSNFIFSILHIPTAMMELQRIKTPCLSLSATGTVKMSCAKTFSSLIGHLIEIFKETNLTQVK